MKRGNKFRWQSYVIFSNLSSGGECLRKLPGGRRREEAAVGGTPEGSDPAVR